MRNELEVKADVKAVTLPEPDTASQGVEIAVPGSR